jgi:hypothetical protein
MQEAEASAATNAPAAGKRPIEEVKASLARMRGTFALIIVMQLLTLAGVGGLLWHTFLRAG